MFVIYTSQFINTMPYYYSKVINAMSPCPNQNIHTFIIDKLSHTVLDKFPLAIIEWGESIKRSMDNPSEIMKFILLSAQKPNQISESEASLILHLCPTEPLEYWINYIQKIDITEAYENWLDELNYNEEENEEENEDEESEDELSSDDDLSEYEEENNDSMPELEEEDCVYDENGTRYHGSVVRQLWASPTEIY